MFPLESGILWQTWHSLISLNYVCQTKYCLSKWNLPNKIKALYVCGAFSLLFAKPNMEWRGKRHRQGFPGFGAKSKNVKCSRWKQSFFLQTWHSLISQNYVRHTKYCLSKRNLSVKNCNLSNYEMDIPASFSPFFDTAMNTVQWDPFKLYTCMYRVAQKTCPPWFRRVSRLLLFTS